LKIRLSNLYISSPERALKHETCRFKLSKEFQNFQIYPDKIHRMVLCSHINNRKVCTRDLAGSGFTTNALIYHRDTFMAQGQFWDHVLQTWSAGIPSPSGPEDPALSSGYPAPFSGCAPRPQFAYPGGGSEALQIHPGKMCRSRNRYEWIIN